MPGIIFAFVFGWLLVLSAILIALQSEQNDSDLNMYVDFNGRFKGVYKLLQRNEQAGLDREKKLFEYIDHREHWIRRENSQAHSHVADCLNEMIDEHNALMLYLDLESVVEGEGENAQVIIRKIKKPIKITVKGK